MTPTATPPPAVVLLLLLAVLVAALVSAAAGTPRLLRALWGGVGDVVFVVGWWVRLGGTDSTTMKTDGRATD